MYGTITDIFLYTLLFIEWGCKDVISFLLSNVSPRAEMAVERVKQITLAERLKFF